MAEANFAHISSSARARDKSYILALSFPVREPPPRTLHGDPHVRDLMQLVVRGKEESFEQYSRVFPGDETSTVCNNFSRENVRARRRGRQGGVTAGLGSLVFRDNGSRASLIFEIIKLAGEVAAKKISLRPLSG